MGVNWAKPAAPLVHARLLPDALSQIECKTCAEGSAPSPSERLPETGNKRFGQKSAH